MKPILQIENLQTHFFTKAGVVKAVDGVSFDINAGEVVGLVGESGSGKSTAAMGLMDLLASNARSSGSVKVKGQEMLGAKQALIRKTRGREVAYIFQEPMTSLNPVMKVGKQITESLRLHLGM